MIGRAGVEPAPARSARWAVDPLGLALATAWLFTLGLGPVYTMRNRIEPLPAGQFIDDARVNAAFVVIHLIIIGAFLALTRRLPAISRRCLGLLAVLHALVIASSLWSLAPGRSAVQGVLFALTTAAALVAGDRVGVRGMLMSVAAAAQIGVVASQLAVRRAWPNTIDQNGDWAGIYLNRNSLGPVAVLALLATVAAVGWWMADRAAAPRRTPGGGVAGIRGSVGAIVGSTVVVGLLFLDAHTLLRSASLTPLVGAGVALMTALVAALLSTLLRRRSPRHRPGLLGAGVVATWLGLVLVAVVGRSEVSTGLGRSATLSGRTELWGWLIDAASRRPFTGWGWLGVWEDRALEAEVVGRFDVDFSTAHNALIEMLLATGVVGVVVLVATVGALMWPVLTLAAGRGAARFAGVVGMGSVGYVVAVNQLETYVGANLLPWALLVGVAAGSARQLRSRPTEAAVVDAAVPELVDQAGTP